jgi:hypothetical protein
VLSPWSNRITVRAVPGPWDELVAAAPPGTLVVDATGLGKDRPGSPLTAEAYDGWNLFCHGWAAALGPILGLPDEVATAGRFAELAEPLRT